LPKRFLTLHFCPLNFTLAFSTPAISLVHHLPVLHFQTTRGQQYVKTWRRSG